MAKITLVVAVAQNGVIGQEGKLPWHLPSELKRFKALTMGKPIIMGRKSWQSLPRKPLPGRQNIVLTRQLDFSAPGAEVVHDVASALQLCQSADEIAVIGGGEIYQMFLPYVSRVYMTVVDLVVAGDVYFPTLSPEEWQLLSAQDFPKAEGETAGYSVRVYERQR